METNPNYYGLPSRVQLEKIGVNQLGIYKVIKSRIIQKDATKIVEIARQRKSGDGDIGNNITENENKLKMPRDSLFKSYWKWGAQSIF